MNEPRSFGDEFHALVLDMIKGLVERDPPADSPEGRFLRSISAAAESYERMRWPIEEPTADEKTEFREEQEGRVIDNDRYEWERHHG